jgi:hypothetical protein
VTWAKLDDTFNDDPTLLALPRGVRLLHVEATVWSCKHETDGVIPRHVLTRITDEPEPEQAAGHLVAAGLWAAADTGYEVVDFLVNQRSAEEVETSRANSRHRQERHRRHQNRDHSLCDPRWCQASNGVSNGVTNGVSNGSPSRPVPTRPVPSSSEGRKGGTGSGASAGAPAPHPPAAKDKRGGFVIDMGPVPAPMDRMTFTMPEEPPGEPEQEAGT